MAFNWTLLCVLVAVFGTVGVIAGYGDAPVSFFMAKKEVKQLLGLNAEIYYLREGVKNDYALNFTVIIPADVTALHFTWENLSDKPVVYEVTTDYSNKVAMEEPRMNITDHGKLPKGRHVFRVEFPCTGKENAEVDITMGVNVTTAYYMSSLRLRRKKICLKNLVDPPALPPVKKKSKEVSKAAGKDTFTPKPSQEIEGSYKKGSPKNSHASPGKTLVDHVAPDDDFYEESPEDRGSVMSIAAPAVPEINKERDQVDGVTSSIDEIEEVGRGEGILAPPTPVFVTVMAAVGGAFFVILMLGGGYIIVRKNKQRRNARGSGDHDLKYESVDMIFCRPDNASTLKRGGSYATIASAVPQQGNNNNNNSPTGHGGTAVMLVTTLNGTKPLPSIPTGNGHVGLASGGSLAGYGVAKNESHESDLIFPNGVSNLNTTQSANSSHNTSATASSTSDKGTLFDSSALLGVGFVGSGSHCSSGSRIGKGQQMWGTGASGISLMAPTNGFGTQNSANFNHVRHKPPFTPKLGGSGRRINGGSRTPIQQMSHPRITLPPPPPETPPPPAPMYATPIYTAPPQHSHSSGNSSLNCDSSNLNQSDLHHYGADNSQHVYHQPHHGIGSSPHGSASPSPSHRAHHQQATVTEMIKELCMDQTRLRYIELVQEGTYGRVYKGLYTSPTAGKGQEVLIKTVTNESSSVQRTLLLGEGMLMFGLSHPNILPIIGVSVEERLSLVYPFVNGGNLKLFLKSCQVGPEGATRSFPLLTQEVVRMATQVAQACSYLSDKDIVHRDLATRNCVFDEKLKVKIADNALSRDLFPADYECIGDGENRPLRWMPPEAIVDKEFTQASDVWAYGVFLWELTTLAEQPYDEVDPFDMVDFLYQGFRLLQPRHCPDELFDLMTSCWTEDPKKRPTFRQILDYLRDFKCSLEKYI